MWVNVKITGTWRRPGGDLEESGLLIQPKSGKHNHQYYQRRNTQAP
jgi:hypothetical protein